MNAWDTLSRRLARWASGRRILGLIAAFVVFEAVTVPFLTRLPGGDIESLDARVFYTPEEAYAVVGAYGDAAPIWIGVYLTWDVATPVLYAAILSLSLSWMARRTADPAGWWRRLNVLPLGAGALDLLENASVATLLAVHPARVPGLAWLSAGFTAGKFALLATSVLLIGVALIAVAVHRSRSLHS